MVTQMRPIVSICIPTYNRSMILKRTIKNLLKSASNDFEIIISDNGSEDNTEKIISSIIDSRIKYSNNGENLGITLNIIKALEAGSGLYCILMSDEDDFHIDELLDFLKDNIESEAKIVISSSGVEKTHIINQSFNKYKYFFFTNRAIGGIFLRDSIDFDDVYFQYNLSVHGFLNIYPHVYIANKLIEVGPILVTNTVFLIHHRERGLYDLIEKPNGKSFKHPEGRLLQFKSNVDYIFQIGHLKKADKIELIYMQFKAFISQILYIIQNPEAYLHYWGVNSQMLSSYNLYIKEAVKYIYQKKIYKSFINTSITIYLYSWAFSVGVLIKFPKSFACFKKVFNFLIRI
jgi:glycosyltransferase involved in cell wall biosynthesis